MAQVFASIIQDSDFSGNDPMIRKTCKSFLKKKKKKLISLQEFFYGHNRNFKHKQKKTSQIQNGIAQLILGLNTFSQDLLAKKKKKLFFYIEFIKNFAKTQVYISLTLQ